MAESPLQRSTLIDDLLSELEGRILSGEWQTDEKIPGESMLAEHYAVSRPVVREALARLRERGYLSTTNGLGTFIQRPPIGHVQQAMARHLLSHAGSNYSVDQLYEARLTIEQSAARLAATRISDAHLAELESLLAVMEDSLDDPERYTTADARFHILIAESTENPLMPLMLSPMLHFIVQGMFQSSRTEIGAMRAGIHDHAVILETLRAHDADRAGAAMEAHLSVSRRHFPVELLEPDSENHNTP